MAHYKMMMMMIIIIVCLMQCIIVDRIQNHFDASGVRCQWSASVDKIGETAFFSLNKVASVMSLSINWLN